MALLQSEQEPGDVSQGNLSTCFNGNRRWFIETWNEEVVLRLFAADLCHLSTNWMASWRNLSAVEKYLSVVFKSCTCDVSAGLDAWPVSYIFPQNVDSCTVSVSDSVREIQRACSSWIERDEGGSVCLFAVVHCQLCPVSRQAPSSGSCTPALSYTSGWQAKLLKGWTEAHRLCLAQLTHKIKTQCYRSVSASLWCQGVLLIRGSPEG